MYVEMCIEKHIPPLLWNHPLDIDKAGYGSVVILTLGVLSNILRAYPSSRKDECSVFRLADAYYLLLLQPHALMI